MARNHIARSLVLVAALAFAGGVRADDLDILSRTVPPDVVIMMDSSGSMSNIILPPQYLVDRVAGGLTYPTMDWFNKSNDVTNYPASFLASSSTWYCGSTSGCTTTFAAKVNTGSVEDYRPTCQIFGDASSRTGNKSICTPVASPSSSTCNNPSGFLGTVIDDDDADYADPVGGAVTIRCWNVPGGCANVPAAFSCNTTPQARKKNSTTSVSTNYTVITLPNVSQTGIGSDRPTLYPPNYLWWMMQQIYLGHTPQLFTGQDRNGAAKQAITQLVNNINPTAQPPRVNFGLARYDPGDNGGYIMVPVDPNSSSTIISQVANIPAASATPLSETLVDIGRYFAGGDKLGYYPAYSRNTSGGSTGTVPPSPVSSSCEKLFVILVTDGLPTYDCNNHYGTDFSKTFGSYNDGDPTCNDNLNPPPNGYLDDVAAYLYATDLRKTISGNQNIITYTVGFTVDSPLLQHAADRGHGTYFQTNNADDLASSLTGALQDIIARNTTLSSATVPSTRTSFGNGFYTAYFVPSGTKSVWPGKLEAYTLTSDLLVVDDNNQPALDPVTKLFVEPRHPHWELGQTLLSDYASRTIYTTKAGSRVSFLASHLYDATDANSASPNLSTTDLGLSSTDLTAYPAPSTSPTVTDPNNPSSLKTLGRSVINWVSGSDAFDEDADGSTTNARPFVFGDVFHSSPTVIGPPLPFLRFENGYGTPSNDPNQFMNVYAHRDRVLYVGANDGMVHAVNAGSFVDPNASVVGDEYYTPGSGHEIFSYIPGFLLNKVKLLPRNGIAKQYYVDGAPTAADAWIDYGNDGNKDPADWTTVMVTPMRQGAEGLLALDVTNPAASSGKHFPFPRLMWEFTNADLGQTWSQPIITRVKIRAASGTGDKCGANDGDGDCIETWVAIFGGGYEDVANPNMGVFTSDPNNAAYTKKGRGIFVVRLSDGAVLAHLVHTPSDATLSSMKYAIASEPAVLDINNDGFADVVYIGDAGGQMWRWDIHKIATLPGSGTISTSDWPITLFFQAPVATVPPSTPHYHSIFEGAAAAFMGGQLWLTFGSGERQDLGYTGAANTSDPNAIQGANDDNNRFWAVIEKNPPNMANATPVPQKLPVTEVATSTNDGLTDITNSAYDNDPNDDGYFFRVPNGVKFMTDQLIFQGVVGTLAYLPDSANSGSNNDCALGGSTIEYSWDLQNGAGTLVGSTGSSSSPGPEQGRSSPLGDGAPTNPRLTISGDQADPMVQTSTGELQHMNGFPPNFDPVDMIFWRQDF